MIHSSKKVSHEKFSFKIPDLPKDREWEMGSPVFRICFLHQAESSYYNEARKVIFKYKSGASAKDDPNSLAVEDSVHKVPLPLSPLCSMQISTANLCRECPLLTKSSVYEI